MDVRYSAARALYAIAVEGQSMTPALQQAPDPELRDRALLRELVFGSCRWYFRLQAMLDQLLQKPLRSKDRDVQMLILVGLYQLLYTRVPAHAAISETVNALQPMQKGWARGLVNGVLRNAQRRHQELAGQVDRDPALRHAHPRWLQQALAADWDGQAEDIMIANNNHPPMVLRVNERRISRDDYLGRLREQGIDAIAHELAPQGIELAQAMAVEVLPGFAEGLVSVQDAAAQRAALLLDPQPGQRVLDACAAPGGKSSHILERADCQLLALEVDAGRAAMIGENFTRLGVDGEICVGDAATPRQWWDGSPFDRILVDAPCSGSGVIRRHPDIKLLRKQPDIAALVERQRAILAALWPLLANNGKLVYSTCSVLKVENELQISAHLARHDDARVLDGAGQGQILPGEGGMDGFFYACLGRGQGPAH